MLQVIEIIIIDNNTLCEANVTIILAFNYIKASKK